jgi:hypothetical protein
VPRERRQAAAFAALAAGVWLYYELYRSLPTLPSRWDVAALVFPIVPVTLGLVLAARPVRRLRGLPIVVLACGLLAYVCTEADLPVGANFAKLAGAALLGFWFLGYFENAAWVALVALIIPWVDAYSVWRGPTHHIVTHQKNVFTNLSIAFPVPGDGGSARLGLPDVLFFSLFLGAADRFGLRVWWTFLLTSLSFGLTVVLADVFNLDGLPALPLLSIGFLAANGDLLWRRWRESRAPIQGRG